MARTFKHTDKVARWADLVQRCIGLHGLEAVLDRSVVLALIHVESNGNPQARRQGSQFCGLLQMGRAAGMDVGFTDAGRDTTAEFVGAPMWSIDSFLRYLRRYSDRHTWDPEHIAVLWKGGPGTLRMWQDAETDNDGIPPEDEDEFNRGWREAVPVYVGYFWAALEVWNGST